MVRVPGADLVTPSGRRGFGIPGATLFRHAACKRRRLCQGDRISGIAPATATGPVASGSAGIVSFCRSLHRFPTGRWSSLRFRSGSGCGVDGSASCRRVRRKQRTHPSPGRRPILRSPPCTPPHRPAPDSGRHFHRDSGGGFWSLARAVFQVVVVELDINEGVKPPPNPRLTRLREIFHSGFLANWNRVSRNGAVYGAFT